MDLIIAIVQATEWHGDLRNNITRISGAGRTLNKRLIEVEQELRETIREREEALRKLASTEKAKR